MSVHFLSLPRLFRRGVLVRLPQRLLAASALARSRRRLEQLDEHLLRDIGLTREQARTEAGRLDWDAPLHWKG